MVGVNAESLVEKLKGLFVVVLKCVNAAKVVVGKNIVRVLFKNMLKALDCIVIAFHYLISLSEVVISGDGIFIYFKSFVKNVYRILIASETAVNTSDIIDCGKIFVIKLKHLAIVFKRFFVIAGTDIDFAQFRKNRNIIRFFLPAFFQKFYS